MRGVNFPPVEPHWAKLPLPDERMSFVAKPNYRFQKQQRELKKSKQQEEKLRKKQARNEAAKPAPQEQSK